MRPKMVLWGWQLPRDKLGQLRYTVVAESHRDTQAGLILPAGKAQGLPGQILPSLSTEPGEQRGSEQGWLLSQRLFAAVLQECR